MIIHGTEMMFIFHVFYSRNQHFVWKNMITQAIPQYIIIHIGIFPCNIVLYTFYPTKPVYLNNLHDVGVGVVVIRLARTEVK